MDFLQMLRSCNKRLREVWATRRDGRRVQVTAPGHLGFRWIVDHNYPREMAEGTYEADLVRLLVQSLEKGDCFLDVGANAGYISLCAKIAVGDGVVVAFEPLPDNVRMIRRIQNVNPRHRFEVVAAAVAAEAGTVELEVPRNRSNPHLRGVVWEHTKPTLQTLTVPAVNLRTYIDAHRPRAVKIDVEGAEFLILSSLGSPDDWAVRPVFFVELHGEESRKVCLELFRAWGYSLEAVGEWSLEEASTATPGQFVMATPPSAVGTSESFGGA